MRAVAHGWKKPGGGGPSKQVAEDFMAADKGKKFKAGGQAKINKQNTRHGKLDLPVAALNKFAGYKAGGSVGKTYKDMEKRHADWMEKHGAPKKMVEEERSDEGKPQKMSRGGGVALRGKKVRYV